MKHRSFTRFFSPLLLPLLGGASLLALTVGCERHPASQTMTPEEQSQMKGDEVAPAEESTQTLGDAQESQEGTVEEHQAMEDDKAEPAAEESSALEEDASPEVSADKSEKATSPAEDSTPASTVAPATSPEASE